MYKNLYNYLRNAVLSKEFLYLLEECGGKYQNGFLTWIKYLFDDESVVDKEDIIYAIDINQEKIYLLNHENQVPGQGELVTSLKLADELYISISSRISIVNALKGKILPSDKLFQLVLFCFENFGPRSLLEKAGAIFDGDWFIWPDETEELFYAVNPVTSSVMALVSKDDNPAIGREVLDELEISNILVDIFEKIEKNRYIRFFIFSPNLYLPGYLFTYN